MWIPLPEKGLSEAGDCHPGAGRLLVIFIHGWILPFRLLKLLVAPCVDQVDHYKRRRHAQDALASAAQHVGDAFAEIAWEGALLPEVTGESRLRALEGRRHHGPRVWEPGADTARDLLQLVAL